MTVDYQTLFETAAKRKGGPDALETQLPKKPAGPRKLRGIGEDRYLSCMAKNIFRAGFNWKVVDHKWAAFEEAYFGFDVRRVASLPPPEMERLARDEALIRNATKHEAVVANARWIRSLADAHGDFGRFLAAWPSTDIVGLWAVMKKGGSRLGGSTAQFFLREMGKDTFMITRSTTAALIRYGVVPKAPTGKAALAAVQAAFNQWAEQSGRPMCHLSRILAMTVPD